MNQELTPDGLHTINRQGLSRMLEYSLGFLRFCKLLRCNKVFKIFEEYLGCVTKVYGIFEVASQQFQPI